ncbi:hypothetical protein E3N88_22721 [Mikania micrantha]|uniref:Retrotransposon gag domain-containing protein n=1 Tax=Mikania micrantha TaxID=192012 RepID=A0A5N6NCZ0_9ASTR|nr:hypothetical protein E3N88_22721 [Mikania micrantha]
MVQTRNQTGDDNSYADPIAVQLAAIAAKLESFETMREEMAALKAGERFRGSRNDEGESSWRGKQPYRPYNKIDFPVFTGGDPRGWLLKAEKYFRYYQIPDEEKVEIASMYLEGDALDLYSWLSNDQPITFWEELVQAFTKNFGPAEYQNPDEFLCGIKQMGTVQEYRQEFAKRSSRVSNWSDHCLLGVFLNGLKDELKSDVRIHKPRTVSNAMSLALECDDKYGPGHRCKTGTLKVLEAEEETEEPLATELPPHADQEETAEISLHTILGKPHPTTMKVTGKLHSTEVLILIDGGSTHNFISDVLVSELKLVHELKITQDFHPFSLGGADLVLGIQWLATLNTVQANWKEMFMIFSIDGKEYKLQGVTSGPQKSSSFQHLAIVPYNLPCIPASLQPIVTQYTAVFEEPQNLPPIRSQDHSIPLLPNSTPPNIRPYRYPHSQKTEIEKQVEPAVGSWLHKAKHQPFF